jgi:hypothetical protein
MQIRPFKSEGYSEEEEKAMLEQNIKKARRDFYIYDEKFSSRSSFEFENRLFAGVTQVIKLIVKGIPDEDSYYYDRQKEDRVTFIKSIYIYNAFMDDRITSIEERFKKAVLRPVMGITSGYTDTKIYIPPNKLNDHVPVNNQFSISIYNFNSRSLMSILCNPVSIGNSHVVKASRLDVTDPRFNRVSHFTKTSGFEGADIPLDFKGKDLIKGDTKIHTYYSYYKNNQTFSEENMLNISKEIYGHNKVRFEREREGGIIPYQQARIMAASDLIDKRRAIDSLIIDITKASIYSLFENFSMQYETGKKATFRLVKPPFKQYHIAFMEEKMVFLYTEFTKLCDKISEMFGRVRILLHINDVEHIVRCIFLDERLFTNKVITLRKTKLECINDYISETIYGKRESIRIREFKEEHDLDILNYYSHSNEDYRYSFQGVM